MKKLVLLTFSLISCGAFAQLTAQNLANAAKDTRYLALGDSLAFGLNPFIQPPNLSKYIGYPDFVSQTLHETLANASCPGETSGTFDGTSSTYYPGYDCTPLRKSGLFVPYNGAANQLQYAVNYLKTNPNVKLVTINIGVNDLGILQADCTEQNAGNPIAIAACETAQLPGVLGTYATNLEIIFSALRGTGYTGPIVFLNASAFNYADPLQVGAITALNQVVSTVNLAGGFNITIADAYHAFALVAAPFGGDVCKTGLLLKNPDGSCDTHPTTAGQALLGATVVSALASSAVK
ncbi:MAG TPA: SGNH/GDSL hydrolase family protein [Bryobacteraceae bacterium]|jgi:lysophospholipase L1-like esterase|nr:SGNH/GDSL hydrolase family protein [Bryobacteraceae bacterium]